MRVEYTKEITEGEINEERSLSLNTVEDYLEEIGKTPLLSQEEERKVAKRIQEEKEKIMRLLEKTIDLIQKNSELFELFGKAEKEKKILNITDHSLDELKEVFDHLQQKKKQLDTIESSRSRERIQETLEELEKARNEYRVNRKRMIEANLRLVVSFAKKYTKRGVSFSDLIQEGNIGLSRAVDKFDYKCNKRFSTYASWWIRQALSRAIADQSRTIRLPIHIVHLLRKLSKVSRKLEQELDREPTPEEIAKRAELSPQKIREALGISQGTISFDKPVGEDGDATMIDFIPNSTVPSPAYRLTLGMLRKEVRKLLEKVVKNTRELEILKLRFGLEERDYSLREIGKKYGVSRERIRQIQERSLSRLRAPAEERGLRGYLELLDSLRANTQGDYLEE